MLANSAVVVHRHRREQAKTITSATMKPITLQAAPAEADSRRSRPGTSPRPSWRTPPSPAVPRRQIGCRHETGYDQAEERDARDRVVQRAVPGELGRLARATRGTLG